MPFQSKAQTPRPKKLTAVIIKGNPKFVEGPQKKRADAFYGQVQKHLEAQGYKVQLDPGLPYTSPVKADLWVGHSRGVDRLRFAPKNTRIVGLGSSQGTWSVKHPKDDLSAAMPNKFHYQLTATMRAALKAPKGVTAPPKGLPGKKKKAVIVKYAAALKASKIYYHGSPIGGIKELEPRLDPRLGLQGLFVSTHKYKPMAFSLLPNRAKSTVKVKTRGGKFVSGRIKSSERLLDKGFLYEVTPDPASIKAGKSERFFLKEKIRPSRITKVTRKDLEALGWKIKEPALENISRAVALPKGLPEKKKKAVIVKYAAQSKSGYSPAKWKGTNPAILPADFSKADRKWAHNHFRKSRRQDTLSTGFRKTYLEDFAQDIYKGLYVMGPTRLKDSGRSRRLNEDIWSVRDEIKAGKLTTPEAVANRMQAYTKGMSAEHKAQYVSKWLTKGQGTEPWYGAIKTATIKKLSYARRHSILTLLAYAE